jgi:L-iditol 2-dehydrogenase
MDNLCDRQGIIGFNADGGFAELMAVPAGTVRRGGLNALPDSLEPATATLAEPLGCCIHGQEEAGVREGDRVAIYGGGPLGLMHAALSRASGAETMVIEPLKERRELALKMGADLVAAPEEGQGPIERWTNRRGADVAILATPQMIIDDVLLRTMAKGGRICSFSGLPRDRSEVRFDINALHYNELRMVGTYGCTSSSNARAVEMLADNTVDLTPLINGHYRLGSLEEAFRAIERRSAMKCVVTDFSR